MQAKMFKLLVCAVFAAAAAALPIEHEEHHIDYHAHPTYSFEYKVEDPHTRDVKSQWEKRDGDKVVGQYRIAEPDGTVRVVDYTADGHNGFNAVVRREGEAYHAEAVSGGTGYKLGQQEFVSEIGSVGETELGAGYGYGYGGQIGGVSGHEERVPGHIGY